MKRVILLFVTLVGLSSCGGGSGPDGPVGAESAHENTAEEYTLAGDVRKLGFVDLPLSTNYGSGVHLQVWTHPTANFLEASEPVSARIVELVAATKGELKNIGCEFLIDANDRQRDSVVVKAESDLQDLMAGNSMSAIGAGSHLTITTANGPEYQLTQEANSDSLAYQMGYLDLNDWIRQGATVEIPGGDFPAFNAVELSVVEPFHDLVSSGNTLSWTASQNPDNSIVSFLATAGEETLLCNTPDTGTFTWPDEINQLQHINNIQARRTSFSYQQSENAVLFLSANTGTLIRFPGID